MSSDVKWRQAVVLIHGIGEQRPMETLRSFVSNVLSRRTDGKDAIRDEIRWFSKPDRLSETLELRRLSASPDFVTVPTDFYELYWAHLMQGTTWSHVGAWWKMLMWRNPWSTADGSTFSIRMLWAASWLSLVAVPLCITFLNLPLKVPDLFAYGIWGLLALVAFRLIGFAGLHYVGDAARYLSPLPQNIEARKNIRNAVVDLLQKLHDEQPRRYHRIIVVGHSLGSVIAYDALSHLWQSRHSKIVSEPAGEQLEIEQSRRLGIHLECEKPANGEELEAMVARYQLRQRRLWAEQLRSGVDWRITDLVTLGSPLTHCSFLLAKDRSEWAMLKKQREYPTAPPQSEDERDEEGGTKLLEKKVISFENKEQKVRVLHHAALFACTRWTNLYFEADPIGGKVGGSDRFGVAVVDVKIAPRRLRSRTPLAHTTYWSESEIGAQDALLDALRLTEGEAPLDVERSERLPESERVVDTQSRIDGRRASTQSSSK